MLRCYTLALTAILTVLTLTVAIIPAHAQDIDEAALQQAVSNIEGSIQSAMARSGQSGQPTLGQLGGVQGGSTDSDASGGAGGESSGGGSGSSGGSGGGQGNSP